MSESDKLKIASFNKDLRTCIIENYMFIEELTSKVLGNILDIDWENSKSFGHGSTSLSFFQKTQLIQDLKGIKKEDLKKLTFLSNIRNKFAHISKINSFEKLFSETNVGKEIQNNFLRWYFDEDGYIGIHPTKIEFVNQLCFYLLTNDVINILLKISDNHYYKLSVHQGKKEIQEKLISFCMSALTETKRNEILKKIKENLNKTTHNKA